jgi:hypothetical protein
VQHYIVWREQQHFQTKKSVFDDAIDALALYEADAMNIELQATNVGAEGIRPITKFRDATSIEMTKALALVPVYFSAEAAQAYSSAYNAQLSPKSVPNSAYYERRGEATRLLAAELRPSYRSIFAALFGKGRSSKTARA